MRKNRADISPPLSSRVCNCLKPGKKAPKLQTQDIKFVIGKSLHTSEVLLCIILGALNKVLVMESFHELNYNYIALSVLNGINWTSQTWGVLLALQGHFLGTLIRIFHNRLFLGPLCVCVCVCEWKVSIK